MIVTVILFLPFPPSQWHTWWYLWWLWWWRRKPRYCESSSWWNRNWNLWKGMNMSSILCWNRFYRFCHFKLAFALRDIFLYLNGKRLCSISFVSLPKCLIMHFFSFSFNIDGQSSISCPKLTICLYFKGYYLRWRDWTATQSFRSRLVRKTIIFCLLIIII